MISLRIGRRGALVIAGTTAAFALIGGVAWAFWTAQATNVPTYAYADSIGTAGAPTGTAAGNSVSLTWPATTTVAGRAVGGYLVNRYASPAGGTPTPAAQGTCAANPVTTVTCAESAVPTGTWYYTITPVLSSWRGNESPRSGVVVGTDTFALSWPGGTTTLTAGTGSTLTITAKAGSQTDPNYHGARTLTFSGPANAPNGTAPAYNGGSSSVTFTNGVTTVPVTLYKAEGPTLSVTAGAVTGSMAFTVNPATASQFAVPPVPTSAAGTAHTIAVTALDAYQNTATGYAGVKTLAWTGPGTAPDGTHTPSYPANPVTFTGGIAANQTVTLYRAESTTLTVSDGSISGTSSVFSVLGGSATQIGVPTPATQTAGTAFSMTLSALDAYKNSATGYSGTKTLNWTGPGNSPSGAAPTTTTPATFSAGGTATVSIMLVKAEGPVLNVSDGGLIGMSGSFTVNPGTASKLAWTHVTSNGALSTPCLFTCTDTGLNNGGTFTAKVSFTDTFGNTVNNLGSTPTVAVSASGGGAFTLPSSSNPVTLTISGSGPADSTNTFTFKTQNGNYTDTLTAANAAYTSSTATLTK